MHEVRGEKKHAHDGVKFDFPTRQNGKPRIAESTTSQLAPTSNAPYIGIIQHLLTVCIDGRRNAEYCVCITFF